MYKLQQPGAAQLKKFMEQSTHYLDRLDAFYPQSIADHRETSAQPNASQVKSNSRGAKAGTTEIVGKRTPRHTIQRIVHLASLSPSGRLSIFDQPPAPNACSVNDCHSIDRVVCTSTLWSPLFDCVPPFATPGMSASRRRILRMIRARRPISLRTRTMMRAAYDACRLHGTLRKAGIHLRLSHERVRQLVREAVAHGLVPALPPKDFHLPPAPCRDRRTTVALLEQHGSMAAISRATGYPLFRLREHIHRLRFTTAALRRFANDHCKYIVTICRYDAIGAELGTHPSCTQLQATHEGSNVYSFIRRHWGSMRTFRRAYGIVVHTSWTPSERRRRIAA